MSEFTKGSKVKIVGGKEGVDAVGEIFWWGDSKYGDGMRAGVKTTGGQTYWVDAEDLEAFEGELPEASNDSPPPSDLNAFSRGDRVNIARGKEEGKSGEIFWWGESKFGDGMRAGIETDDGDKVWAAGHELERASGESAPANGVAKSTSSAPTSFEEHPESFAPSAPEPSFDDEPLPDEPPPFADEMSLGEIMDMQESGD